MTKISKQEERVFSNESRAERAVRKTDSTQLVIKEQMDISQNKQNCNFDAGRQRE